MCQLILFEPNLASHYIKHLLKEGTNITSSTQHQNTVYVAYTTIPVASQHEWGC